MFLQNWIFIRILPILSKECLLTMTNYVIHSFHLYGTRQPEDRDTVSGHWSYVEESSGQRPTWWYRRGTKVSKARSGDPYSAPVIYSSPTRLLISKGPLNHLRLYEVFWTSLWSPSIAFLSGPCLLHSNGSQDSSPGICQSTIT